MSICCWVISTFIFAVVVVVVPAHFYYVLGRWAIGQSIAIGESACMCVYLSDCPLVYIKNCMFKSNPVWCYGRRNSSMTKCHQIFCTCCLWLWFDPSSSDSNSVLVRYVLPVCGWRHVFTQCSEWARKKRRRMFYWIRQVAAPVRRQTMLFDPVRQVTSPAAKLLSTIAGLLCLCLLFYYASAMLSACVCLFRQIQCELMNCYTVYCTCGE